LHEFKYIYLLLIVHSFFVRDMPIPQYIPLRYFYMSKFIIFCVTTDRETYSGNMWHLLIY